MDRIKLGSFAGEQVFMAVEGDAAQDIKESAQHISQQPQYKICPACNGSKTVFHHAFDSWGILCPKCSGTGKLRTVR
jgi:hypothetical protein